MEAYILRNLDMMGFPIKEQYFLKLEKAIEKFDEKIEEYRNNENLASAEDALEHNLFNESIFIEENHPNYQKEAMVYLWYKCSYEYDEWDITVEHLEIEKIQIEE